MPFGKADRELRLHLRQFQELHNVHGFFYCVGGRTAFGVRACATEHAGERFVQSRVGLHHLCFRARTREDVDRAHELVRGLGAMIAVEFNRPGTDTHDADFTKRVQAEALKRGLILLTCGLYGNGVRVLVPITVEDKVLEEGLAILEESLKAIA
jgi:adenosylmethionine-8-amino-7-oxononanoate aminotransferase